jgi:hypothetical protein
MSGRSAAFVTAAALVVTAFLLSAPPLAAGPTYHAPPAQPVIRPPAPSPRPVAYGVGRPVTVVVAVEPAPRPAVPPYYVNLRGPDGRVRRFPVEGGRAAIQAPEVVVLRPGESVTVHLQASK